MKVRSDHYENLTNVFGGAKNGNPDKNPQNFFEIFLKLIYFDLIFIEKKSSLWCVNSVEAFNLKGESHEFSNPGDPMDLLPLGSKGALHKNE